MNGEIDRQTIQDVLETLDDFEKECEKAQYTDTYVLWCIVEDVRQQLRDVLYTE